MTQQIKVHDGKLELRPGGVYDMINGNYIEFNVAKLHILLHVVEKMIDIQCDCGEVQDKRTPHGTELMAIAEKIYDEHYRDLVENFSLHKVEFPNSDRAPITIPEFLLKEPWQDISYHNDSCPSFIDVKRRIKVWVDYDNAEHREMCLKKFYVVGGHLTDSGEPDDIEWGIELYETECETDLIRFLEEVRGDWG